MDKGQLQYMNGELQARIADLEQQIDRLKQELNAKAWDDRTEELELQLDLARKDANLWKLRVDEAAKCIEDYEEIEAELVAVKGDRKRWERQWKDQQATITRLTQGLNETQKALTDCMSYVDVDNLTMQTKEYNWNSVLKGYQFNRANCDTTRTRLKAPEDKPCAEKEE